MTRQTKRSRLEQMDDDFLDIFTTMANDIADHLGIDPNDIYDITDAAKLKAQDLYLTELYGREQDKEAAEDKYTDLERDMDELRMVAINAKAQMPIIFTLHDDAIKYGWQDRDAEAWSIVTHILSDLDDMAGLQA